MKGSFAQRLALSLGEVSYGWIEVLCPSDIFGGNTQISEHLRAVCWVYIWVYMSYNYNYMSAGSA